MIVEIPVVNGQPQWPDPDLDNYDHPVLQDDNGVFYIEYTGPDNLTPYDPVIVPETLASGAEFGRMLPDQAIVDLYDIRNDTTEPAAKGRIVTRLLLDIATDTKFDPFGSQFTNIIMPGLVLHTALTQPQADAILADLQAN